jgi:tripartite-type tricarboxylate transporter receptor subunit TctC
MIPLKGKKMKSSSQLVVKIFCLTLLVLVSGSALAAYPDRPVRLIVPFPPGGPTDIVARPLAQNLSENLGQQVIVDNRGGAGGNIGAAAVVKSAADGYSLLMGTVGTHAINASLYKKLTFDPVKDFAPVSLVAQAAVVLVVHPSVPAKTLNEFIALAKFKPAQITFGSAGSGSPGHLTGELFKDMAGVDLVHVPYQGSAPAISDLLGGQIHAMFDPIQATLSHVKAGKLRILGVSSSKRSSALPDVPTIAEAGVPGFETTAWWAVFAPAGTPKEIITKLNTEIVKIMRSADMKERLRQLDIEPIGSTPDQLAAFMKTETAKWSRAVKFSGAIVE